MRTAYFDCFAGASGDMIVGALIDLGLDPEALKRELARLDLPGWELRIRRVDKLGVSATKVDVLVGQNGHLADSEYAELHVGAPGEGQHHHHHGEHPHRGLSEILAILERSGLHPADKALAARIFRRLGEAEASVHGVAVESVHFHEVGGVDAIIDVVSAAVGLRLLGIERVCVSPLHVGSGFVRMAHGLYPVPGPATAKLLTGAPAYTTSVQGELVTPTGAAILTTVANSYGPMPPMTIRGTGYGAGTRDREIPNVLRLVLGDAEPAAAAGKAVVVETNLDDMNPELYGHLYERLLEEGALDVAAAPVLMKKGRPGQLLQVLTLEERLQAVVGVIFAESSAIGVRSYSVTRFMLEREQVAVATPYGEVRVKAARAGDSVCNVAPEYEDCRSAARAAGVPLKRVYQSALAAWELLGSESR